MGRLDYRINDKNSLNGMFFISPGTGTFVDDAIHEIAPQWLTTQYARSQVISGNWVYVATPAVVNSLRDWLCPVTTRSSERPTSEKIPPTTPTMAPLTIFTPGRRILLSAVFREFKSMGFPSFQLGGPVSWPKIVGPDSVYQFTDSVSIQKGKHAIKFGGEVLLNRSDDNVTSNNKGPVAFRSLDNFFTGHHQDRAYYQRRYGPKLERRGLCVVRPGRLASHAEDHNQPGIAVRINHRGPG